MDIPKDGGYLPNTQEVITVKTRRVHSALGIGGSIKEASLTGERLPMIFIIGGVGVGDEGINPDGQVAIALPDPNVAFSVAHAALSAILSSEALDIVTNMIKTMAETESAVGIKPSVFANTDDKLDMLTDMLSGVDKENFKKVVETFLAGEIDTAKLSDEDKKTFEKLMEEFLKDKENDDK